jgi:serine/threonine protein phosphatase PrpC
MKFSYHAKTDIGSWHNTNRDEFYIDEARRFFLVSDGGSKFMKEGTTSGLGVATIAKYLAAQLGEPQTWPSLVSKDPTLYATHLRAALKLANHAIYQEGLQLREERKLGGFGAVVAALWLSEESAFITHLGDCRVYRFRKGSLEQLTEDHSLLNDYIKMKKLTPEEIEDFPHKNVIVRALGIKETVQVDVIRRKVLPGDLYLLCTNGIHNNLSDKEIAEILPQEDLQTICSQLIDRVNQNERADNSTGILVRCG